eukprot:TRINITY_DN2201_c0_g1_i1.p2 TRINITY_DN2201_c0_g1~~TRINITY_DN2201_c0_g1_i1.p2  ORF type:complete len:102 (-),score=10.45 TRINITY_DN2201_c0_g1_i1:369-674(-)
MSKPRSATFIERLQTPRTKVKHCKALSSGNTEKYDKRKKENPMLRSASNIEHGTFSQTRNKHGKVRKQKRNRSNSKPLPVIPLSKENKKNTERLSKTSEKM